MSLHGLTCEIELTQSTVSLGAHYIEPEPLPGAEIVVDGQSYLVMERRNRYRLRANRYELSQVILQVKGVQSPTEKSWHKGQWVLGDLNCQFNARSPVLRCAVNPQGPCRSCEHFLGFPKKLSNSVSFQSQQDFER